MTGPERRAFAIARGWPNITPRKLAKKAGIKLEVAKRIIAEVEAKRRAT